MDVGSGTGIFTRQIAAALPSDIPVIGIERASQMREQASSRASLRSVTYRDGTAERLPVGDRGARAVLAATAAHWFDRTAFYIEAERVLLPGGVLGIVEYVRDEEHSPAARSIVVS